MTTKRGDWIGEVSTPTKADGRALIECRWTLLRDGAGESRAILAIITDITENKKLEEHLFRAQRMESIGTLAGGIAHDLNNVLGPIIMGVDLLKLRIQNPQDRDLLELMETSGQRGVEMVKQVLFFARGVEGRRSRVAPGGLIDEMERIIRDTFPKDITVKADVPKDTWPILGDRAQLHQVLLNLCVNARDAMPKGGRLHLAASNREVDAHFAAM